MGKKYFFYDEIGDLQTIPDLSTTIISEKELPNCEIFSIFPSQIGFTRKLKIGAVEDIVLDGDIILKNSTILDPQNNPVPENDILLLRGGKFQGIFSNNKNVFVVEHEGKRIWFSARGCFLEDIERFEKNKEKTGCLNYFVLFFLCVYFASFIF